MGKWCKTAIPLAPITEGGKRMEEKVLKMWADPESAFRVSPWFMERGRENLDALQSYDKDGDSHIGMTDFSDHLLEADIDKRFNMGWLRYQAKTAPCRIVNAQIHLNHSLWWFKLVDAALNGDWKENVNTDARDKYLPVPLEHSSERCLKILAKYETLL
jgi:hypothetical protein